MHTLKPPSCPLYNSVFAHLIVAMIITLTYLSVMLRGHRTLPL
jgi:hypothetical protein